MTRIMAELDGYYTAKPGIYPWPCAADPERVLHLFEDDILTRGERGYTKHNGLMMVGIMVPDDCVTFHDRPATMVHAGNL